ncbi:hypothetical protein A8C56_09395 [Niabella ginsenosidivorans]|uniref:Uncharacterized protein n=1 Tax=Niabella ginsenosidivorans TaxID=1176587 RepID=A0A1A9I1F7_9BACT|nr:hypothetical protein [Niabella ginsenosidivorans]ANH81165.1 hypothetical protein A8C56_09395 [Niabella ginsenosidivorans]
MNKIFIGAIIPVALLSTTAHAQDCKTSAEVETMPGKYQPAAQYPWPAVKAEYFKNMVTAPDKAMVKKILADIENIEAKTHVSLTLTGGNWENIYSTKGYAYLGNTRLGQYSFEASLHEFFCLNGKLKRNDEAGTILRIYVNAIPFNTLSRFLDYPFGSSLGEYDFGFQFLDWENHKPVNVNDPLIRLFNYFYCNNEQLIDAINSGKKYFQDVAEKDIKPNNRNNFIYRYWFVKKKDVPVLVPVSRKEYLQSLLEYYEREKLYFPKLISELSSNHNKGIEHNYGNWEADVTDKIGKVKKALSEQKDEWLQQQAVVNKIEDASQNYKAKLKEKTNYNRFWRFYDREDKSQPLYKINPDYFKRNNVGAATPQLITVAFRYVTIPSSLRILNNFTEYFDFEALKKLLK